MLSIYGSFLWDASQCMNKWALIRRNNIQPGSQIHFTGSAGKKRTKKRPQTEEFLTNYFLWVNCIMEKQLQTNLGTRCPHILMGHYCAKYDRSLIHNWKRYIISSNSDWTANVADVKRDGTPGPRESVKSSSPPHHFHQARPSSGVPQPPLIPAPPHFMFPPPPTAPPPPAPTPNIGQVPFYPYLIVPHIDSSTPINVNVTTSSDPTGQDLPQNGKFHYRLPSIIFKKSIIII